ncbi:Microtubule-associated protein, microtubule dynamics during spindle orientation, partial [Kappamyces sp. JEL0680]
MFSTDHYKEKHYLAALKQLDLFVTEGGSLERPDVIQRVIATCDLVLRYLTLRFFDTNTSIFIKSLEFLEHFITALDEGGYFLNEFEAASFLPFFVNKLGDPKESMRVKLRTIVKKIGRIYPVSKLFAYLVKGLDSKNSKTRAECLEEMASLIQRHGQNVFQAPKLVPIIALQVGDRDAPCRNAALTAICNIYEVMGEELFKFTTKISEKERDMINERIKRLQGKPAPGPRVTLAAQAGPKPSSPSRSSTPTTAYDKTDRGPAVPKEFSLDLDKIGLHDSGRAMPTTQPSESVSAARVAAVPTQSEFLDDRLNSRIDVLVSQLNGFDRDTALDASRHLEKLVLAHPNHEVLRACDLVGAISPSLNQSF